MREFISEGDPYYMPDRGWNIYPVRCPDDVWEPGHLCGETVLIDGVEKEIASVEAFAVMRSKEHPYRGGIGLAVKEPPTENSQYNGIAFRKEWERLKNE